MKIASNTLTFSILLIGLFMAILDIQIVASSLGEIQAHFSASMDEMSWVQTSYLIGEVIMIPMTSWLSKTASTRYLFALSAGTFTLSSALCAFAPNFQILIILRTIQGFVGGAMIPTVFSSIFLLFPKEQQTKATIFAGLIATMAPTFGPILGGWITANLSWHWLFLVNIPPGLLVTYGVYRFVHFDQPDWTRLKTFDFLGFALLILSLGGLELFLKEGGKNDWFDTFFIRLLFVMIASSGVGLIWYEWQSKNPLIELHAFLDRNFTAGCLLSFAIGVGLYGSIFLLPLFLTTVKGFNSLQIGYALCMTGFFQFFSGPLAGALEKILDLRVMLFIGLFFFGFGVFLNSSLTLDTSYSELFLPQAIRGLSLMLCFLPMTSIALGKLPPHLIQSASGLFNLMRNLGGAIGIALIDVYLNHRIQYHYDHLCPHINETRLFLPDAIMQGRDLSPILNLKWLQSRVLKQAFVKGFNDTFFIVGLYLMLSTGWIVMARKVQKR